MYNINNRVDTFYPKYIIKEKHIMKITIKKLSQKVNVPEATIRAWLSKPIEGVPYDRNFNNYDNLVCKLESYYSDFETKFGFKAREIEIEKAPRTTRKYIEVEQLEPKMLIVLHNYSLKKNLVYVNTECIYGFTLDEIPTDMDDGHHVFLFYNIDKENYEVFTLEELKRANIKIEVVDGGSRDEE